MSRFRETLGRDAVREWLVGGAHLAALWAFAFVQPLLDLLGRSPDFFVARSNTPGDIVILAVGFTVLPPLLLLAIEGAVGRLAGRGAYLRLHLVLVALLAAVFFVQVEKRIFSEPASLMILVALALGALVAYGLRRFSFVRSLLDVLAVAPVLFVVVFLFFSDTSELVLPQDDSGALGVDVPGEAPVVILLFDELPTATLMNARGGIDAERFPNFARLARRSTWYRNNTTVADFTGRAVPAIFTGSNPGYTTLPISSAQPNSIFTLLGGAYDMHVDEAVTQLCPENLCGTLERPPQSERLEALVDDLKYVEGRLILPPALANGLPNVSATFGDFGNNEDEGRRAGEFARDLFRPPSPGQFEDYLDAIPDRDRTLNLVHMQLPHEPFRYLPDGRLYGDRSVSDLSSDNAARWAVGAGGIASIQQRHFVQTAYADRLVGRMIRRLREAGIWDRALVVVTADHGISFLPRLPRRVAVERNLGGVANPPLFIKYPRQRRGGASDVPTRSVDIVPTIAEALGVEPLFPTQGKPISRRRPGLDVVVTNGKNEVVRAPLELMVAQRDAVIARARYRLGDGGIFELGPRPDLIRTTAPPLSIGISPVSYAVVESPGTYEDVDPDGTPLPALVAGTTVGVAPGTELAISVNGRIVATTRAFIYEGEGKFGVVVPPTAFSRGFNQVGVYRIDPGGALLPLGGN